MSTSTTHTTATGEIMYMAINEVAAAAAGKRNGSDKPEFSVKIKLNTTDPAVEMLREVAPYKLNTKTNLELNEPGHVAINFSSNFPTLVMDSAGNEVKGSDITFFDGRTDTGTAQVTFKVIDYGNKTIVRLAGVKLESLEVTPKELTSSTGMSDAEVLEAMKAAKS